MIYLEMQQPRNAVKALNQAIELDPKNSRAYFNRGIALTTLGDTASGLRDLDAAIRFDPKFAIAYFVRGAIHHKLGHCQKAAQDLKQACQLKSEPCD